MYAIRRYYDWLTAASPLWQKIWCQSHFCLGSNCPEANDCFLNHLRRDAANSRLLIVNHHLLFSDLAVRRTGFGEVLPRYESVIFDEAHVITSYSIHYTKLYDLVMGSLAPKSGQFELTSYVFTRTDSQTPKQFQQDFQSVDDAMAAIDT